MSELNVGVRQLKMKLSAYLRELKKGKTIVITDHGKPVGRLIPTTLPLPERIEAMRLAGIITWSGRKPKPGIPVAKRRGSGSVADLLVEDRE